MKQILYFLIGFCIPFIWFSISYATVDCIGALSGDADIVSAYDNSDDARDACYSASPVNYCTQGAKWNSDYTALYHGWTYDPNDGTSSADWPFFFYNEGDIVFSCSPAGSVPNDTDEDGIPDGLDAYPDTDSAYQFRIMTNYFDSEGNCVGQLIVTSSGDYVLLGDLTAAEIEAGVSAGTYTSDFVNSPIWIDSSDLEDDNASDIYASGDSTTPVNSTTASGLTDSATTANSGNLSTADGVTSGSTYDSGTDTDSSALGKIVDNTAAATSNQQTLANYAKKQTELQGIGNSLGLYQSAQLAQMNSTLGEQATTAAEEKTAQEQEASEGKTALEGLDVNALLGEDINGELVEGEDGDYQDHVELIEETWVQELINSNPITTVLTNSGFKYSSGSSTATLDLGELGSHTLDISDLEAGLIAFGNLLVSFTTLYGLVHVITGRGF
jgi:hypothetical protein